MNIDRLLYGKYSKYILALLLGFGLATIFRKVCNERDCIVFKGPKLEMISDKAFKYGNQCYKVTPELNKCSKEKKSLNFA